MKRALTWLYALCLIMSFQGTAFASRGEAHARTFPAVFLFVIVMLVFARAGALVERIGQPAVLGELLMGVVLAGLAYVPWFSGIGRMRGQDLIADIAEIGVVLLLFRTGLESDLDQMRRVGLRALLVAAVGVTLPFVGGYFAAKVLMPGLSSETCLFIGAALTATSVGITARVFKDLHLLSSREAQIVLGAAVFDDILGLVILAVVAGLASGGSVSVADVGVLVLKSLLFLGGALAIGQLAVPPIGRLFSRLNTGAGMKMAFALLFCGAFAYAAADLAGLAPIVGAFAAGLVLEPVHFTGFVPPDVTVRIRELAHRLGTSGVDDDALDELEVLAKKEEDAHVENLVEGIAYFFVPIFFVYTGLQVDLSTFAEPKIVGIALVITAVAFIGKVAVGWIAGPGIDRPLVGFGMVPRGEVGLIFADVGKRIGVVNDAVFSIVVITVVLTTLLTPPILGHLTKRRGRTKNTGR